MNDTAALRDLLLRMADDELIIAHRNSEWTGLGPIMEEDIAFSSIAQDKLGHSLGLYRILESLGGDDPDTVAFGRSEGEFRCCHLVEYPIGGYDFSLMRHFLHDTAELLRYEMLEHSSVEPLARLAAKIKGEIKYHLFHANTWIAQLGARGTEESHARMQSALNEVFPLALGMFEPSDYEAELEAEGIFPGEAALRRKWLETIAVTLEKGNLVLPSLDGVTPVYGGRKGYHTEHLKPLLDEMTEVFRIDPSAEW
ncbi:MAG: 1,2-phenylacetyl-CoA epoxidase subunit PaaC [Bacteroidota bacterium]